MRVTGCDTTFTIVSIKSGSTLTVPGSLDKFTVTNVEFKSNLIISGNVTMVDVAQVTNSEIKLTGSYKTVKLGSVESGAVVDISGTVETVIVNTLNSNSVIRISGDGSVKKIEAQLIETNGKIDLNSCVQNINIIRLHRMVLSQDHLVAVMAVVVGPLLPRVIILVSPPCS